MQRRIAHLRDAVEQAPKPMLETAAELIEALLDIGDRAGALHVYQRLEERFPIETRGAGKLRDLYERALWLEPADLPTNVPTPRHRLVGRGEELRVLGLLAQESRYVALTGPGGIGKSRLALELARHWIADFPGGSWWIDCTELHDEVTICAAIARVLNLPDRQYTAASLADALRTMRASLVFDCAEGAADAVDRVAATLTEQAPELCVLATSRQPLARAHTLPLASLRLPLSARRNDAMSSDAVRLFVERAVAADASFALNDANAEAVVRICGQLDGIPLAIELAAAYLAHVDIYELETRLSQRTFADLAQTVSRTIDWAHRFLAPDAAALLRRCSVYPRNWTVDDAVAMFSGDARRARTALEALVGSSLVLAERDDTGLTRYRMLDTTRTYARARLEESGEAADAVDVFLSHLAAAAADFESRITKQLDAKSTAALAASFQAVATALEYGRADECYRERALRIAGALGIQLGMLGFSAAFAPLLRALLDAARGTALEDGDAFDKALRALGWMHNRLGFYAESLRDNEELIERARRAGDSRGLARSLALAVVVYCNAGRYDDGLDIAHEAIGRARALGDVQTQSVAYRGFAGAAMLHGRPEEALEPLEAFLNLPEAQIPSMQRAMGMIDYAEALFKTGALAKARAWAQRAVERTNEMRDAGTGAHGFAVLGGILFALGERENAHQALLEAVALCRANVNIVTLLFILEECVRISLGAAQAREAAEIVGFIDRTRERHGIALAPERRPYAEAIRARLTELLDAHELEAALASGSVLGAPEAIDRTSNLAMPPLETPAPVLTDREMEIASLVAQGLSNKSIAAKLCVSLRTVENHLHAVYSKLGIKGRTNLALYFKSSA
ncbi:MAG TPA: LuxR C-terminal-related transcriptional regulator [Candidatus Aquilonibacter sp.]|nr:LuxR C-terminal-related transcriptional regulator [Candidatus Aquilonibacter sp.]